jgi:hypothetical protein
LGSTVASSAHRFTRRLAVLAAALAVAGLGLAGVAPAAAVLPPVVQVAGAPAPVGSFVEYNGLLYLAGDDPDGPYSVVWTFDGSTFTELPNSPIGVVDLTVFDGKLLITAPDDLSMPGWAYMLYSYDGATITPVVHPFDNPSGYFELGGILYFTASVGDVSQVWLYDGTTFSLVAGTYEDPFSFSEFQGRLYFNADADTTPGENELLFVYDPAMAPAPAVPVAGSPTFPTGITTFNGLGYLGGSGQLYSFDGTSFTVMPGVAPGTNPGTITAFAGGLYFVGFDGTDYLLYSYANGVATPVPGAVTETQELFEFDGKLFFLGFTGGLPTLHVLENSATHPVPGSPQYTFNFIQYDGVMYFTGDDGESSNLMYSLAAEKLAATGADFAPGAVLALCLLAIGATALARRRSALVPS